MQDIVASNMLLTHLLVLLEPLLELVIHLLVHRGHVILYLNGRGDGVCMFVCFVCNLYLHYECFRKTEIFFEARLKSSYSSVQDFSH